VTASVAGYSSRTTHVFLPSGTATLDFILDPLPTSAAGARLRGEGTQGSYEEEKLRIILPPGAPTKATSKVPVTKPGLKTPPTNSQKQPVEMVTWKPTRNHRKGLHFDDGSPFASSIQYHAIYLLPLVSVMAILLCLFVASKGGYRYQTLRSRVPKVEEMD
jgi:hypothetical protein